MNTKMYRTLVALVALSMAGASTAWAQMSPPTSKEYPSQNETATQSNNNKMNKMSENQKAEGTVQSVDSAKHTLTLEDGTMLTIPASVKVAPGALKKGAKVSATFKEQNGKRVVTSLHVEKPTKS